MVLPLVSVRVERVQDITEEDAKAEGLRRAENGWTDGANGYDATSARMAFRELWESIYGEASWDENPCEIMLTPRKESGTREGEVSK